MSNRSGPRRAGAAARRSLVAAVAAATALAVVGGISGAAGSPAAAGAVTHRTSHATGTSSAGTSSHAAGSSSHTANRGHAGRPRSSFAVGSVTDRFVDDSRSTPADGHVPAVPHRTLQTLVLYPAAGHPGGAPHPGARPATAAGPFPLIVFSHGFDSDGPTYEPLLRQFAAAGYVVAAPTFPLSSDRAPGGVKGGDYVHQPGDVSFVITQVLDRSSTGRGVLHHLVDPSRIGVAGHSLGGATTLGVAFDTCCRDRRVSAAVSISGLDLPFPGGHYQFGPHSLPLLLLHGTADDTVPYETSRQVFAKERGPTIFVTLIGANHVSFRQAAEAGASPPPWERVDVRTVVDFFDYYLKHERGALDQLRRAATVPGVARLQTKDLGGGNPG